MKYAFRSHISRVLLKTDRQSRLLQAMTCDEMQGYIVSKAVLAAIFEQKFLGRFPA